MRTQPQCACCAKLSCYKVKSNYWAYTRHQSLSNALFITEKKTQTWRTAMDLPQHERAQQAHRIREKAALLTFKKLCGIAAPYPEAFKLVILL